MQAIAITGKFKEKNIKDRVVSEVFFVVQNLEHADYLLVGEKPNQPLINKAKKKKIKIIKISDFEKIEIKLKEEKEILDKIVTEEEAQVHSFLKKNKIKTKKDLSKTINLQKLKKILDNNYNFYKNMNLDDLGKSQKLLISEHNKGKIFYDNFDVEFTYKSLKEEILNSFCPHDLNHELFKDKIVDKLLFYYNGISIFGIIDLLKFSLIKFNEISWFRLTNTHSLKNNYIYYPELIYFYLELDNDNFYLIKAVFFNNDRAEMDEMFVVKKFKKKFDKKILNFVLNDSLNTFAPQSYPWDDIVFNSNLTSPITDFYTNKSYSHLFGLLPFLKSYIKKSKKIIAEIKRDKIKTDAYEYLVKNDCDIEDARAVVTSKPILKASNK